MTKLELKPHDGSRFSFWELASDKKIKNRDYLISKIKKIICI